MGGSKMSSKNSDVLVELSSLCKYFYENTSILDRLDPGTEQKKVHAVDDVDLKVNIGEVMGIVGESGCGKSTLARTMLRLIEPTSGSIYIDGEDITEKSKSELNQFRKKAQFIHQDPSTSLNPRHTVHTIIKKPLVVHGIGDSDEDRDERVRELLERVDLDAKHLDSHPHEMSGGQKQRVVIARALALSPDLLVADEPTSTLDASVQARILNLMNQLQEEDDLTMMIISHDLSVINHITDQVAVMYLGQFVEKAPTLDLFENPRHPYTKALLSSVPVADPSEEVDRVRLEGDVPSPINPPNGCRFHTRCPKQIPPNDWTSSKHNWLELYSVKQNIQVRMEKSDDESDLSSNEEEIFNEFTVDTVTELSNSTANTIESVRGLVSENKFEEANELLDSEFVSPCETEVPVELNPEDGQMVRCHLHDEERSTVEYSTAQTND